MKFIYSRYSLLKLLLLLTSFQVSALALPDPASALKTYIEQDDGAYKIEPAVGLPGRGYTAYLYNLTSQQWLTEAEVNQPVWTHSLVIIVPTTVSSSTAMLYVGGGNNGASLPDASNPTVQVITQIALLSQTITAAVFQVPNQPLIFTNEVPRVEDALVAYTWQQAMNTSDYSWPAYLPMAKSVVKAMDGIQSATSDLGYTINDFVLTGFSKRGNAVWLTASIDPRVKAIAPGVIDNLNLIENFEHHYKAYGDYSLAIADYMALNIPDNVRSPEFRALEKTIDPYHSLDALTMPKFILNSSGDEFFLPDSSRFYFDDLTGEKHIRFAPNTGHSLSNSKTDVTDTLYSLLGWYQTIVYDLPRPNIQWTVNNGVLSATTSITPVQVRLWRANNPSARDFRRYVVGEIWTSSDIQPNAAGEYSVTLENGSIGYTASYIEFMYMGLSNLPVSYSTQVYVTPDVYPYAFSHPVVDPKHASFWHQQVKNIQAGRSTEISADTLNSYVPIPLFADIVNNLDDMNNAFRVGSNMLQELAERECLATRLNIRHGELGWHSTVDLGWGMGNKELWEYYKTADEAANDAFPWLSALICVKLNSL